MVGTLLTWMLRYPVMVLTGVLCWIWMRLANKTIIIGRHHYPRHANVLIASNHYTMIDSWWITIALCWPWIIYKPWLLPYHLPEKKNFYKGILGPLCELWRCIPISRGTGDFLEKMPRITEALRTAALAIFPQGGRSRNHQPIVEPWRPNGMRELIAKTQPTIVPVGIYGIQDVLPIGHRFPHWRKTVVIVIGQPLIASELTGMHDQTTARQTTKAVCQAVQGRIQHCLSSAHIVHCLEVS